MCRRSNLPLQFRTQKVEVLIRLGRGARIKQRIILSPPCSQETVFCSPRSVSSSISSDARPRKKGDPGKRLVCSKGVSPSIEVDVGGPSGVHQVSGRATPSTEPALANVVQVVDHHLHGLWVLAELLKRQVANGPLVGPALQVILTRLLLFSKQNMVRGVV